MTDNLQVLKKKRMKCPFRQVNWFSQILVLSLVYIAGPINSMYTKIIEGKSLL
jgi:hypothetical protein